MDKKRLLEIVTNDIEQKYSSYSSIYTDASTHPDGKSAIAFHSPDLSTSKSMRISNGVLPYSAEAVAIRESINFAKSQSLNNFIIFTDALTVLNDLMSRKSNTRSKLINSIINSIYS